MESFVSGRRVLFYYAWSRMSETQAPLQQIDDRFPTVFELRRLFYPKFEILADPINVDQGIAGFLDEVQKPNFAAFIELAAKLTGNAVKVVERADDAGLVTPLDGNLIAEIDTIIVISFDSLRTMQAASRAEVEAVERFLQNPDHVIFVCPHHDIGETNEATAETRPALQAAEHSHHGDPGIPPRQGFGGFARTLLAELGVPVQNRFGLRPAADPDGSPTPIDAERALDALGLLNRVETFNLHAHLPQLERLLGSVEKMDVLARQKIDLTAPPHPFVHHGRESFDALLQSSANTFLGKLLVCDTTMFSSTVGGLDSLRRLWTNLVKRPSRALVAN